MVFPVLTEEERLRALAPPSGRIRAVLDTDAYNEIDDQFAIVYALSSRDRLDLEAIYAAPFDNPRSTGAGDGMEKSYDEILKILDRLGVEREGFAFRGSTSFMQDSGGPCKSDAAEDLVRRAMSSAGDPLYVIAIGAPTNVSSAILLEPEIIRHIVVVWLGGQPFHWHTAGEFNLKQDLPASRVLFDSGVPLVHIPCACVASHLQTTIPEIEKYVEGRGAIGDYLAQITREYASDHFAWSKVIWDIATIGYLVVPRSVMTVVVHSPILTDQLTWSHDPSRHFIRNAVYVHRDPIFADLFRKLEKRSWQCAR